MWPGCDLSLVRLPATVDDLATATPLDGPPRLADSRGVEHVRDGRDARVASTDLHVVRQERWIDADEPRRHSEGGVKALG